MGIGNAPAIADAADGADLGEAGQRFAEAFVADVPELPGCAPTAPHRKPPSATRKMPFAYGSTRPGNLVIRFQNRKDVG